MCSVVLINFNKYLISSKTFPFPMYLVLMHTITGTTFASILFRVQPSLFPSLSDPIGSMQFNTEVVFRKAFLVAIASAGNLVLSNMAYMYATVAFLQFMKEGNVVLVYVASLITGLEFFKMRSLGALLFIMAATSVCIAGELHFSALGFLIQGMSQVFEVIRIVLQTMLLSASGMKLDALTYVLVVMPMCFAVLLGTMLMLHGLEFAGVPGVVAVPAPSWTELRLALPLLAANAVVAFSLNVTIALFIKNTSAVSMVLAGIVKDCAVVLLSLVIFQETITRNQAIGFAMQLVGVFLWSIMKQFPDVFEEHGVLGALRLVLTGSPAASTRASSKK